MNIIKNLYGIPKTEDLKEFSNDKYIFFSEVDFLISYNDTLWLSITREKTNKIVITMENEEFLTYIKLKYISKIFNDKLDFYLVFDKYNPRYNSFLNKNDSKEYIAEYDKKYITNLLSKNNLNPTKKNIEDIFNKKITLLEIRDNKTNNNSFGI